MHQPGEPAPRVPSQSDCVRCAASQNLQALAASMEHVGLATRLQTYSGDTPGDAAHAPHGGTHAPDDREDVEMLVVTNPRDPERGELRVGDDGNVTWEFFGKLDPAGRKKIVDEAINALRASGMSVRPHLS